MGRVLGLMVVFALASQLALVAQQPSALDKYRVVPTCEGTTESADPDRILIGADGGPVAIPLKFFDESPKLGVVYRVGGTKDRLAAVPLWETPEMLPVFLGARSQGGFVDPDVEGLSRALRMALALSAPVRFVNQESESMMRLHVESLGSASTDRDAYLLGQVSMRVDTIKVRCTAPDAVRVDTRAFSEEIRQLCETPDKCAGGIADSLSRWIEQNFGLTK